jgi:hypothetical protein
LKIAAEMGSIYLDVSIFRRSSYVVFIARRWEAAIK